jgi:hypothetical protein
MTTQPMGILQVRSNVLLKHLSITLLVLSELERMKALERTVFFVWSAK